MRQRRFNTGNIEDEHIEHMAVVSTNQHASMLLGNTLYPLIILFSILPIAYISFFHVQTLGNILGVQLQYSILQLLISLFLHIAWASIIFFSLYPFKQKEHDDSGVVFTSQTFKITAVEWMVFGVFFLCTPLVTCAFVSVVTPLVGPIRLLLVLGLLVASIFIMQRVSNRYLFKQVQKTHELYRSLEEKDITVMTRRQQRRIDHSTF
jgi:membrane protein implicated in regulation of membrane protease activity